MNLFDMKTVIFSYIISNAICMLMVLFLYFQNRRRFEGLGFWLADFILQFIALDLVAMRGVVPDLVSMTLSNTLVVGGTVLLLTGLERFLGKRRSQFHNIILLAIFIFVHVYFVIYPDLRARNIIFSLGLLAICSQCAWLMLRRTDAEMRPLTNNVGIVFVIYCLVSIIRIIVDMTIPADADFFRSNLYDTSAVMLYQMLFIGLTFSLLLMVNHRLTDELEHDITVRVQAEEALRLSEEKFQKAFHSSPDAIIITRASDGQIVEVNEGFSRLTEYSREEALGNSTIALDLWVNPEGRESFVSALQEQSSIRGVEYNFRSKYGKALKGLISAEIIQLGDVPHILSVIQDITERKQMEEALRESEERYQAFISQSLEAIYRTEFDHPIDISLPAEIQIDLIYENAYMAECNLALADMYGLPSTDAMIGMRLIDAHGGKDNPINRAAFRKFIEGGYKSTNDETVERDLFGNPVWFLSNTIGIVEGGYLIRMWGTSVNLTERKRVEEALQRRTYELGERVKELNCLYDLADLVETSGDSIEVLMQGTAELLPPAWQYPSSTCARVTFDGQTFSTSNFRQTPWSLQRPILVNGVRAGSMEVYYLEAKPDGDEGIFLQQEERLLDAVAERLGKVVERIRARRALHESEERYRLLFETMAQGVVYQSADGRITSANPAAERILGLTLDQLQGRTSIDPRWRSIHKDGSPFPGEEHPSMVALQTGEPVSDVTMGVYNPRTDEYHWINVNAVPQFRNGESIPYQVYATFDDITERKQTDETFQIRLKLFELSSSYSLEELMQKALDEISPIVNSPVGFYHFVEADQKTLSLQAWSTRTLNEFCKAEGSGLHYPVDQAGVWTDCIIERKPVIHNNYPSLPHRKGLPPGHAEVIRELVVPILRNGSIVAILGVGNKPSEYTEKDVQFVFYIADVIWEIVERKRTQEKLQQLSRAVEQSPASIVITDTKGAIEYVNPRFTEVTGYGAEEVIGKNPRVLKTDKTPRETFRQLWREIVSGREWHGEFINRKKNGEEYYEYANISPIKNEHGIVTHYLAVKEDITGQKMAEKELRNKNQVLQFQLETIQQLQAELREQAIRDPLTGLYNRRYLYETMGRELARAQREKYSIGFMMMDIDYFKQVNDTYGHAAGDKVLVALADLFRTHVRQGDIACRYGGEEFLVVMLEVGEADTTRRAEEIRRDFNDLRIIYDGAEMFATISVGVAFYPRQGNDADMVIKAADVALYKAKQTGRNRVYV